MHVTITQFRRELFRLVDRALAGEAVQFTHKGVVFQIVPESVPDKLAKLTRQTVVAPESEFSQAGKDLLEEMEAEWQKDWAEL
jgi:antitoxin (DNA-binding transcriptional repressor) of toxin-antitoxin stability system